MVHILAIDWHLQCDLDFSFLTLNTRSVCIGCDMIKLYQILAKLNYSRLSYIEIIKD